MRCFGDPLIPTCPKQKHPVALWWCHWLTEVWALQTSHRGFGKQRLLNFHCQSVIQIQVKPKKNPRPPKRFHKLNATYRTEGMAELQVESIDWHLVAHRQDSHGGEVAGRVGDIGVSRHAGQAEGWSWKRGSVHLNILSEGVTSNLLSFTWERTTTLLQIP